jgi:uncharacterized protein involved in response to NO
LVSQGVAGLPPVHDLIDRAALGTLHAGLFGWAFLPAVRPFGALLLLAAALNLTRLAR